MEQESLRGLLEALSRGEIDVDACEKQLRGKLTFEDLGWACIDHHRRFRDILPEVVYGSGKSPQQIAAIVRRLSETGGPILVTRVTPRAATSIRALLSQDGISLEYSEHARALYRFAPGRGECGRGYVLVVTAGTADMPVAEEACITLELAGHRVERLYDAGVAGVHRLLSRLELISQATVIIAIAGMDGALPSVVGGLSAAPVIAVPTSTGYGANLGGVAPLLTMLNSCATGVAAVNIDNGFGAATVAAMINRKVPGE